MRPFVLHGSHPTRVVLTVMTAVAVATAALAAPAGATVPDGITREMIVSAAQGLRTQSADQGQRDALDQLIRLRCGIEPSAGTTTSPAPLQASQGLDGVAVTTQTSQPTYRQCTFVAMATTDASARLDGTITVEHKPIGSSAQQPGSVLLTEPVSGGVFVTGQIPDTYGEVHVGSSGTVSTTSAGTTTVKVADPKSRAQKRAARSLYLKRLRVAKKRFAADLRRAHRSEHRRSRARTTYDRARRDARTRYRRATADHRLVRVTETRLQQDPFSATALVYSLIRSG